MESEPLLDSLRSAVTAMPDDVPLRLHLASLLLRAGQRDEAVRHLGAVLQRDPGNGEALALLTGQHPSTPADPAVSPERTVAPADDSASSPAVADPADDGDAPVLPTAPTAPPATPATPTAGAGEDTASYDWSQAEDELRDVLPAMFVGDAGSTSALDEARAYDAEPAGLTLADVAGLTE
ncbi:MAG TPA: tetratricopeptide repeat protein, partial [Trebonia sp.]|nr:tetratricopeptide repeat protein [Trebonia sp.]